MLERIRRLFRSKKRLEPMFRFDFDLLTKTWKCVKKK